MKPNVRLEEQIEQLRMKMYQLYQKDPTDQQILQISQELDLLLNQYQQDP